MDDMLQVGVITSTHGIKGEVKVFPTTDDNSRFNQLKTAWIDMGKEKIPVTIEHVKFFKQFAILKFKGLDKIEDMEQYKSKPLLITRDQAVELQENEYFIADLIDMDVFTDSNENLGKIKEVIQTGANDVYCVQKDEHSELLIPAIKECVLSVDVKENRMKVHLLDGLRE